MRAEAQPRNCSCSCSLASSGPDGPRAVSQVLHKRRAPGGASSAGFSLMLQNSTSDCAAPARRRTSERCAHRRDGPRLGQVGRRRRRRQLGHLLHVVAGVVLLPLPAGSERLALGIGCVPIRRSAKGDSRLALLENLVLTHSTRHIQFQLRVPRGGSRLLDHRQSARQSVDKAQQHAEPYMSGCAPRCHVQRGKTTSPQSEWGTSGAPPCHEQT